jgi:hypothetical protein
MMVCTNSYAILTESWICLTHVMHAFFPSMKCGPRDKAGFSMKQDRMHSIPQCEDNHGTSKRNEPGLNRRNP